MRDIVFFRAEGGQVGTAPLKGAIGFSWLRYARIRRSFYQGAQFKLQVQAWKPDPDNPTRRERKPSFSIALGPEEISLLLYILETYPRVGKPIPRHGDRSILDFIHKSGDRTNSITFDSFKRDDGTVAYFVEVRNHNDKFSYRHVFTPGEMARLVTFLKRYPILEALEMLRDDQLIIPVSALGRTREIEEAPDLPEPTLEAPTEEEEAPPIDEELEF